MEVHAHSHTADPDSHRGKKKWHHYFWEFLMLFFAVTLGFFVENQREHMAEHQREKQFMQSMLEDLKSDTAQFASNRISRDNRIQKIRFLLFELTDEIEVRSEYRRIAQDMFDGKIFNSMLKNNTINRPLDNPP